jgi:hypothetical protein
VASITPQSLSSRESTQVPLKQGLGGLQIRSGHYGEVENLFPLLGFEAIIVQPVD